MPAHDKDYFGMLADANFADYVLLFDWPVDSVRHTEVYAHFPRVGRDGARQPHRVFPQYYGLRNAVDLPSERIRVAVRQQAFAGAHPQNRARSALQSPGNDVRRA